MTDITMIIDPNTPDFTDNFFNSSDQETLENNIGVFSGKYGSIKFVPQKDEEEIKEHSGEEFIFIVDCSGSMSGPSIKLASECLIIFMKSLPENCYFNVIRFGTEYGVGKLKKESFKAVQNTNIANQNDRLYLFCLMVSAKLLDSCLVKSFSKQIDDEINKVLNRYNLSFEWHDLNKPKYHDIKISWLLFLSQTVDFKGEELKNDYHHVPLACAGELLNNVQGDLQDLAYEMHQLIKSSQKCACS